MKLVNSLISFFYFGDFAIILISINYLVFNKMKNKLIIFVVAFLLLMPLISFAQVIPSGNNKDTGSTPCTGDLCIQNPLGSVNTPQALIGKVVNNALGVVGSIALLMFVYGGLVWMTSAGSSEKVKNGRDILIWSAIGMAVIFSAYGLTRFVLTAIAQ